MRRGHEFFRAMKTPVALIIFNRPEVTRRVFQEIARARPQKLLVIADGPRAGHPTDAERCADARAIIDEVDWECEVLTNYSPVNLGCKMRPASGISWVFEQVEQAIIFEDDCLPHPSFFPYCDEMLERYSGDERVMMISGNNFQMGRKRTRYSYYFSRYPHTWGWATWRRAWRHFDAEIKLWPELRETSWLFDILGNRAAAEHWRAQFDALAKMTSVWDYQWVFACWAQNGLTILPSTNLVSNIGWGDDATHTKATEDRLARILAGEMSFPLEHPPYMIRNLEADRFTERLFSWGQPDIYQRLRYKLGALIKPRSRRLASPLPAQTEQQQ
jgi:hypothetical protein